jgi:acyl-CoA thioesterase-1
VVGSVGFYPSLSAANAQAGLNVQSAQTVLVYGDSLSAAYGMDESQGWAAMLESELDGVEVVNASISGETTSGGRQRLENHMIIHRPAVLVLELGANDALRGQNLAISEQNLQHMIDRCQQAEFVCQVVLLGVQLPPNYGPLYNAQLETMYVRLAQRNALEFDPFFLEEIALESKWMQRDGLHPNAEAQPLILKRVLPRIERALQKVRKLEEVALQ